MERKEILLSSPPIELPPRSKDGKGRGQAGGAGHILSAATRMHIFRAAAPRGLAAPNFAHLFLFVLGAAR